VSNHFDPITNASVTVRIEGKPVPKGRPRFSRNGGVFTPKTTADFEKKVALAWRDKYGDRSFTGKVEAFLYFGTIYDYKQDIDNLVKSVLDGLQNGGAFVNSDEQVYKVTASKYPSAKDEQHTIVVLRNIIDGVTVING
jgi:crossover junction endodeoxyribonuclease RusA